MLCKAQSTRRHDALHGSVRRISGRHLPVPKDPAQIKSVSREELERVKAARRRSLAERMEGEP